MVRRDLDQTGTENGEDLSSDSSGNISPNDRGTTQDDDEVSAVLNGEGE